VGWYFISVMIAERLLYLTHAAGVVLLPAAARYEGQRKKTPVIIRLNLLIIFLGALVLAAVSPFVIPAVLSPQYQNSVLPLIVYLPGVIAITLPKVLAADLAARGLPQYNFIVSAVNFTVNLVLNLLLIPRIGIIGAALSSTISYTIAAILISYAGHTTMPDLREAKERLAQINVKVLGCVLSSVQAGQGYYRHGHSYYAQSRGGARITKRKMMFSMDENGEEDFKYDIPEDDQLPDDYSFSESAESRKTVVRTRKKASVSKAKGSNNNKSARAAKKSSKEGT